MASIRKLDCSLTSGDCREFTYHLLNDALYLPDILRNYPQMIEKYAKTMSECLQPWALVGKQNQLGGVVFMSDVVPGHEAVFYCWIWDGSCYTSTTRRFMDEYVAHCAEEFGIHRVVARTPDDKKLGKLLDKMGFRLEGRFRGGFKHGGRLVPLFQFRKLFA